MFFVITLVNSSDDSSWRIFRFLESHQRKLVDCSSPTYKRAATSLNPTTGRWWIVQARPACARNPRRLGLNNPPPAGGGIRESIFAVGRLGLNNPPPAGGGIQDQRDSKDLGNDKLEQTSNCNCGDSGT